MQCGHHGDSNTQAQEDVGTDRTITAASADSSDYSESNVKYAQDKRVDADIATDKRKHNEAVVFSTIPTSLYAHRAAYRSHPQ